MSITSTQIAVQENFKHAWRYAIGVAIIEIIYLRLTLFGVGWIIQHKLLFQILGWLTVAVFLILGITSFISARKQETEKKRYYLIITFIAFFLGLSMSALNPAQILSGLYGALILDKKCSCQIYEFKFFTVGCGTD
jgi:threonine/homoserine/homoserine lactone efflux protein